MKELEVLENMIKQTLDKKFEYTKNELLNQIILVGKVINTKDKEIDLKELHIKELEALNSKVVFKANMYESMIKGIFENI